jgi:hypothetical protein
VTERLIFHHTGLEARGAGAEETIMAKALSDSERVFMDAYWRAANYLSVDQISREARTPRPRGG